MLVFAQMLNLVCGAWFGQTMTCTNIVLDNENGFGLFQVVRLKQVEHTLNEKRILQAIKFPFLVALTYHFKVRTACFEYAIRNSALTYIWTLYRYSFYNLNLNNQT